MSGSELRAMKMFRANAFVEICVYDAGGSDIRTNEFSVIRLRDFDNPCMLLNLNGQGYIVAMQPVETLKHILSAKPDPALSVLGYLNLPVVLVHVYLPRKHRAEQDLYVEDAHLPLFGQTGPYSLKGFNLKPLSDLRSD